MQAFAETFNPDASYIFTWKNAEHSNKWSYSVKSPNFTGTVTP